VYQGHLNQFKHNAYSFSLGVVHSLYWF